MTTNIQMGLAIVLSASGGWRDYRTGRIPNLLNLAGGCAGVGVFWAFFGLRGLLASLTGALIAALVPLILFKMRAMGGGDVKLFAALGALLGAGLALEVQMAAFFIGGLQGIVLWASKGQLKKGFFQMLTMAVPKVLRRNCDTGSIALQKTEIRLGPAIFFGTVAACSLRLFG